MNVRQKFSVSVIPKWKKTDSKGETPIYLRIKVDGSEEEISLRSKVKAADWDSATKRILPGNPDWKSINKKIERALVDIERHFDLVQAKFELATAALVKESYAAPSFTVQAKNQKLQNFQFNESLDNLINRYLTYCKKLEKAHAYREPPSEERLFLLNEEKHALEKEIKSQVQEANKIYDKAGHQKTFILTVNNYFLNFIQLTFTGQRAYTTLEKNMCRKRRFIEFFQWKYKKDDLQLSEMKYELIEELKNYCILHHGVNENSANKLAQFFKEMVERAFLKGWIERNVYSLYTCGYEEIERDYPTYEEMITVKNWKFSDPSLSETRDISLFQGFTGLSYREAKDLCPGDIVTREGEKWININRHKTGNKEPVPLLPIAMEMLEKYADHPKCQRTGRSLPVPSNQEYNRRLKTMAEETGLKIEIPNHRTHDWRYFFANEVAYDNGIPLKTISNLMAHKSVRTTEKYIRPNKRHIKKSIDSVRKILFREDGNLRYESEREKPLEDSPIPSSLEAKSAGARIVQMSRR